MSDKTKWMITMDVVETLVVEAITEDEAMEIGDTTEMEGWDRNIKYTEVEAI